MLERQPIEQMSADELVQLAPAYLQFGDADAARSVCERALTIEPTHPRASMWLREVQHATYAPLDEQLRLADRCIEKQIEPRVGWQLIRASVLCRMSTERDRATGKVRVIDEETYQRAANELKSLGGGDDESLAKQSRAEGWIEDWHAAFPGLAERSKNQKSTA